jgi:hypothetical protein
MDRASRGAQLDHRRCGALGLVDGGNEERSTIAIVITATHKEEF